MTNRKERNRKPVWDDQLGMAIPKGIYIREGDDQSAPECRRVTMRIAQLDYKDPKNRNTKRKLEEHMGYLTGDRVADAKTIAQLGQRRKLIQAAADRGEFDYCTHFPEGTKVKKAAEPVVVEKAGPTFGEVADAALAAFKASKGGNTASSEMKSRERRHENLFKPFFGADTPMADIALEKVHEFVHKGFPEKTTYKTRNNVLVYLRNVFKYAVREKFIEKDLTSDEVLIYQIGLERETERTTSHNEKEIETVNPFTKAELQELLKACEVAGNTDFERDTFKAIVTLGALTGLRSGEMCGLAWEDIEITKNAEGEEVGTLYVRRQCVGVNDFKLPKHVKLRHRTRFVDLTAGAIAVIREQYERVRNAGKVTITMQYPQRGAEPIKEKQSYRFLFTSDKKRGEYIKGAHNFDGSWQRIFTAFQEARLGKYAPLSPAAQADSKLAAEELKAQRDAHTPVRHFYHLRHTFASQNLTAGVPMDDISQMLGHKDAATTRNHYAEFIKSDKKNIGGKLVNPFEK